MRRTLLALALALGAIALAAGACVPTAGPGWTFAPPTVPPPSQPAATGGASAAPSSGTSGAPTSAAPSEAASGATGGAVVQISALNVAFEQTPVSAPAGAAFVIHFNNKDAGVLHDVAIRDAAGTEVFRGDPVTGPAEVDYQVPALPAGTYQFVCTIHPGMAGMLMVGG
jgi:plastocyanin